MATFIKTFLLLLAIFLLAFSGNQVESLEDGGTKTTTYQVHEEVVLKVKARKLMAVDIVLDYDYGGANPRHDPRRGRGGGKVP